MVLAAFIYLCGGIVLPIVAKQSFEEQPSYVEVNPGASSILRCRVFEKSRQSQCIWQKDEKPIRMQDGKYEWSGRQDSGDCGLRVIDADINFDDGSWRCQVTASSFDSADALSSRAARLVVRIPPDGPRIFYNGSVLGPKRSLQISAGEAGSVRCESRGGNPPARLRWLIDGEEIPEAKQQNETDFGDRKRWNAISVINTAFKKEHNGKRLKCLADHAAYPRGWRETSTILDVQYAPIVRLERPPGLYDLEADKDALSVRCLAEANPKPDVVWRKAGGETLFRVGEELFFDPVRQGDGGTYLCLATNELGASDELSITFDVLFGPRNLRTAPTRTADLQVGSKAKLECFADGNPTPHFEWLQKKDGEDHEDKTYSRANTKVIEIKNVSYDYEGLWACSARNTIKGLERKIKSSPVRLDVSGKPQVVSVDTPSVQSFGTDEDADLKVIFCSDPPPREIVWEFTDSRLKEGESNGRFLAARRQPDPDRKDCFFSSLSIAKVVSGDSGVYFFTAKNERGQLRFGIKLQIVDPITMTTLVGIAGAALLFIVALACFMAFTLKNRKEAKSVCCAKKKGDSESETSFYPYVTATSPSRRQQTPPSYDERDEPPVDYSSNGTDVGMQEQDHQIEHLGQSSVGSATRKKKSYHQQPTYPLPPASQFQLKKPLGVMTVRKTPQNLDEEANHNHSATPAILYADLQFPKSSNSGSLLARRTAIPTPPQGSSFFHTRSTVDV